MATYTKVYNNPYPDGWKDGKDGKTPVTADILNNQTETIEAIEQYLADNPIEQGGSGETGTTDYNDLTNKPRINGTELSGNITLDIPTKTSDLENDSGFLTEIPEQSYNDLTDKPQINGIDLQGNLTVEELGLLDITESTDTTLENSKDGVLKIKEIYGNTEQDGTPTTDTPIEPKSVVLSEIWSCRKNLLDYSALLYGGISPEDGYTILSSASILYAPYFTKVERGESYIFNVSQGARIYKYDANKKFIESVIVNGAFVADCDYIRYQSSYFTEESQLEIGTVSTAYEPYTESIVTLPEPITLNGIGGVQDYADLKRRVKREKCYVKAFTGKETLTGWTTTTGGGILFGYTDSHIANNQGNGLTGSFCNYLTETTSGRNWNSTDLGFSMHQSGTPLRFRLPEGITTLAEAQAWMAEKYASGNPFTVIVARKDIIETPLPDADVEALKSLKTYDGVTHIFTDSEVEPDWFLEYNTTRVGTELDEIDAELAKINKRITDIGTTAQINYSTEEQVVGTWIDGKPLYQKTIVSILDTLSSTIYNYANNVDKVIDIESMLKIISETGISNFRKVTCASLNSETIIEQSATSEEIYTNLGNKYNDFVEKILYVTIQYTKTTDTV